MKILHYREENAEELKALVGRDSVELDEAMESVKPIISQVKSKGDSAIYVLTRKLDKYNISPENIKVSDSEIRKAYSRTDKRLVKALEDAALNIGKYHAEQYGKIEKNWETQTSDGVQIGEKIIPLKSVGCYIPGGRASYPSTVLMTTLPAKAAGVSEIILVSPPPISDAVLVAADICGIKEIYRVGGAQAIAALAYGTESIPRVDKITGPGNKYVLAAKMLVYGQVDIDMPAGPSEVLVIADESANPGFIAADVLAQAEHDPSAQSIVVTTSKEIAEKVLEEIGKQLKDLKRKELKQSLKNSAIILTRDVEECIEFANLYAPEHLEILTKNPEDTVKEIRNAGAVFIGPYSPVAAGDYASGGNHVLPTGGTARFASELSVRDFLRNMSIQHLTKEGLSKLRHTICEIAGAEGFQAHKKSIDKRFT
ncbi:MAG: histidinol dehydrogenase [Candidatus Altiarchaeales archaeon ex4484_2]|nr:MAG: histidinol dehydrogenase [Candidatus Altiarchaeales archaeon ex4484_2]